MPVREQLLGHFIPGVGSLLEGGPCPLSVATLAQDLPQDHERIRGVGIPGPDGSAVGSPDTVSIVLLP
jgi:hypothetical protein